MSVSTQKLEDDRHCNDRFGVRFSGRRQEEEADNERIRREQQAEDARCFCVETKTLWVGCISKWTLVWTIHAINDGFNMF